MRKIIAGLFTSLDGVAESPEKWTGPYFNDEVGQAVGTLMATNDTLLLGRVTYEGFAAAFGQDSGGMADQLNSISKVVVSSTLTSADWQNSTLIGGDVAGQITKLKQQPGQRIGMSGSSTLVSWLLGHGLLDQLDLVSEMRQVTGQDRGGKLSHCAYRTGRCAARRPESHLPPAAASRRRSPGNRRRR